MKSQLYRFLAVVIFFQNIALDVSFAMEETDKSPVQSYLRAYPDHLSAIQGDFLIWKDGTRMPIKNEKQATDFQERLNQPDLDGQISIQYPLGRDQLSFTQQCNYDSGRIRYDPFFTKMYGSTSEDVKTCLIEVPWLPNTFGSAGRKLFITQINGVADKVRNISNELDALPSEFKKYLENPGGSFCWRNIAGTNRISAHSFGMTVDINVEYSHYWLWDYKKKQNLPPSQSVSERDISLDQLPAYRNQIPLEIVDVFEKRLRRPGIDKVEISSITPPI